MKLLHEMTITEWQNLSFNEKAKFPEFEDVRWWNHKEYLSYFLILHPSGPTYYLLSLVCHIKQGGKITKRIWNALLNDEKTTILVNLEKIDTTTIKTRNKLSVMTNVKGLK